VTDDITTVLIGIIKSHNAQYSDYAKWHAAAYGSSADNLSLAANWAQILGTAGGPAAQAAAVAIVQSNVEAGTSAAAEEGTLFTVAGAEAGIIGAGITLLLVGILVGVTSSKSGSGSAQDEQMAQLAKEFSAMAPYIVADYWDPKLGETGAAALLWSDVGAYLDDLYSQGTVGHDVVSDEPGYHHAAQKYVNAFYSGEGWEGYWQSPPPLGPGPEIYWYGGSVAPASPPGSANIYDPTTALPFFVLGLNAYLTLESVRNMIPVNPPDDTTLLSFAKDFQGDLIGYLKLLYQQYSIAVTGHDPNNPSTPLGGIAKTAPPPVNNILGFLSDPAYAESIAGSLNPGDPDQARYPWNGCYGAILTYPSYGVYPQSQLYSPGPPPWPNPLEIYSPSYFINRLNTNIPPSRVAGLRGDDDWNVPWIQNKVTLGTMARWKALYLINGYDRVWRLMQGLQDFVNQALKALNQPSQEVVPPVLYLDDETRADGNWSARELCNVLQLPGGIYSGEYTLTVYFGQEGFGSFGSAYSLNRLLLFLLAINGLHITSPPSDLTDRPLSFRALLAACDDESYSLPLTPGG
jgi:hypothetical protein